MSTKLITQLNPFSTDYNISEVENSSISEIIGKLDKKRAVNTGWRVLLNDQIITDFQQQTNDGDTLYIKLVPEGDGSPQSVGVGEKWVGAILTVVGAILMITGYGTPLGMALIGTGVGIFASGVTLYNIDFSNLTKNREQPEQSPSIRGSKNNPRPLGYIPILLGKRRIYPDPAANPFTWVDEKGDQYLYQLFCCGQKDQEIDKASIKIGETPIKEYSATGSLTSILNGNDKLIQLSISHGGETTPIFNRCIHEDMYNSILLHETDDGTDASIIKTTPDDTEEINVDIFFYNGLGQYNDDGEVVNTAVQVEVYYKKDSEDNSQYKLLGYFNSNTNVITGNELKTKRYSVTKSGLAKGKYTVKVSRKTDDSKDAKVVDTVFLGSIRSIKNQQPISSARCRELTLIGLKIKVSSKLNGYVEQLNFVSQAKNTIYNDKSKTWMKSNTSNPASAAIFAMQGQLSQQKLSNSEIDWPAFEKLFTWCKTNNYECNEYIYDSISISEVLNSIASTCRAEIFRRNGKITVIQDIERDGFVQVFTPRNSWAYKETILKADIPDALSLQLIDEASNYAQQELKIYNTPNGNYITEPDTVQDVPLWGVTSNVQARKLGMYKYAVTKNRPIIHNFSCDFEYMLCSKGDWIKYAGDIALAGITQGRVLEVIKNVDGSVFGFLTDEQIPAMDKDKNYSVRVRLEDGSAELIGIKNQNEDPYLLEFEEAKVVNISEGCLFTYGIRGEDSIDLIITDIQCADDLSASITAVSYSPEIFDVDNPDFVLPEFVNRISDIPSINDSGDISASDLEKFETYHDGFSRPETPLGDGTGQGWHLFRTPYARWQSSKLSKTIDSGKWSAPEEIIKRGKSILKIYKEPEEYSSVIGETSIDFRIRLEDIFESPNINEILIGDIIEYSVFHYEIVQRDDIYAYLGALTSIQGEPGSPGKDGNDGNGINSITYFYAVTEENNIPSADSVISPTIPATFGPNKPFLWQKEVITYTKSSTPKTTVALICVYGKQGDRGSKWFSGTAVSGTGDKTITLAEVTYAGDMYLNTSSSDTYICKAGAAALQESSWSFNGNIKGNSGDSVTDVVLSSTTVPIATKINGKTESPGTYTINFYGRTGSTAKDVTAVSISTLPFGLSATIPTTTAKNSITFLWGDAVDFEDKTTGDLTITLICDDKTIVKRITWTKVVSKVVVDELLVNKLKSMNFSNIAGQENGFCFNGTNAEIDFGNDIKVPANTEVHYGNAIYDSDYIKNSDRNLCVSLGHLAGYRTRYRGTWNSTVTYTVRDVVTFGNNTYWISTSYENIGHEPEGLSSYWKSIDTIDPDTVAIGYEALANNAEGINNVAIGYKALSRAINADNNVVIGNNAVRNAVPDKSVVIGSDAYKDRQSAGSNFIAIGFEAMKGTNSMSGRYNGSDCIAIGSQALRLTTGRCNIGIGNMALYENTVSEDNIAIGYQSMYFAAPITPSSGPSGNVCIGSSTGFLMTGYRNVCIGYNAGSSITSGCYNICIGDNAQVDPSLSDQINIGNVFKCDNEGIFLDSGCVRFRKNKYGTQNAVLDLQNSDIKGLNALFWNDDTTKGEGLLFPRSDGKGNDGFRVRDGYAFIDEPDKTWALAYRDGNVHQLGGATQTKTGPGRIYYKSLGNNSSKTIGSCTFTYSNASWKPSVDCLMVVNNNIQVWKANTVYSVGTIQGSNIWFLAQLYTE